MCFTKWEKDYTFGGEGLSQGHSDAIRRVNGVKYGVQYTVPVKEALEKVRNCEILDTPICSRHKRICYVVCEDNEDKDRIEKEIKTMPNYFAATMTPLYSLYQRKNSRKIIVKCPMEDLSLGLEIQD